jgi:hypothetical protein
MSQGFDRSIASPVQPHVPATVWYAAATIRYSFYLVGALVLGMIGIALLSVYAGRVKKVEERPSFHLDVEHLARLPVRSQVLTGARSVASRRMNTARFTAATSTSRSLSASRRKTRS